MVKESYLTPTIAPPAGEPPAPLDPSVCASCGQCPEVGRSTPLCASCRSRLAARPLPSWIQTSAVALVVPFVVAIARFPAAISAGVAFERGKRAEATGAFPAAVAEYEKVVRQFPNSTLALAREGIAAFHAGEYRVAVDAFDAIGGRKASPDIVREVNDTIDQMKKLQR
jgi:hypothetical protein